MIKLQIIGNLGKDCVLKEVNGKNVINFNVAHTERFKDSTGMQRERTTWVECAFWTDRTAISPYLLKGQLVYVEGSPEADAYLNKENQPAGKLKLRVRDIQLLGGRTDSNSPGNNSDTSFNSASANAPSSNKTQTETSMETSTVEEPADDLPF